MGVVGLCIGTTVGTFVHMSLYLLIVSRTNWMKESSKVQYVLKKEAFKRKYPTAKYIEDRYARTVCTEKNDYFMLIIFPYCTIHHLLSSLYQQFTCKSFSLILAHIYLFIHFFICLFSQCKWELQWKWKWYRKLEGEIFTNIIVFWI